MSAVHRLRNPSMQLCDTDWNPADITCIWRTINP